jgi:glutathione S-transferase
MKVYYHPVSTTSRIVMLYAAQEAPDLEFQVVDLLTGEHLKPPYATINPNCLVPVLEDGDFRLTESSTILKYLADLKDSPSYPKDLRQRARVNEVMDWFNTNLYRDLAYGLVYPQAFAHHRRPSPDVQAGTLAWAKEKAKGWLRILDESLIGPNKRYLCGETITLADYLGAEMVGLGELIRCNYSAYANVERWLRTMKALPSWPKVHEVFYGFAGSLKETPFVAI